MNNNSRCICCHSTEFDRLYSSPEGEIIKKCCRCGLISTEPGQEKCLVDFYGERYYRQWHDEAKNRLIMWRKRLQQLNKFCRAGSLLDVGCGLGDFARIARDDDWDVTATEVSEYAANHVFQKHNIKVMRGEISDINFDHKKFDVVAMWHVLEHIEDPLGALRVAHSLLREDGLLVVEVPNVYYLVQMAKSYFRTRNAFSALTFKNNPEPHYFHFSIQTFKKLLHIAGFRVTNICVGIYGEHQSGILRRLKSKIYNIITVFIYMVCRKNIGVNTRIYAVKKNKPLTLAMVSLDVRRDLDKPLENFQQINIKHYYRRMPYEDMTFTESTNIRLVKYKNGFDLFIKILRQRPDLIQGIEPYTFPAGFGEYLVIGIVHRLFKVPYFFPMLENRPPKAKFGRLLAPLLRSYLRSYASRAEMVIPLNEGARGNLLEVGVGEEKLIPILWGTWGVDVDEFTPVKDGSEPDFGESRVILFVGRLHKSKGVMYLLRAFVDVYQKMDDVKLILIGDGPLREKVGEFIEKRGLKGKVILKGPLKNKKLPPYFRRAHLTVTPSITTKRWKEQIGMVNIQSMACGTPVVSTFSGAIPEYVRDGKTGTLVQERDVDELSNAILRLLSNERLRSQMGEKGRRWCLERFDAKINIKKAERLLLNRFLE